MVGQACRWHLLVLLAEGLQKQPSLLHHSWETTILSEAQPTHLFGIAIAEACHRLRRVTHKLEAPEQPGSFPLGSIKRAELCTPDFWISSLKLEPQKVDVDRSH